MIVIFQLIAIGPHIHCAIRQSNIDVVSLSGVFKGQQAELLQGLWFGASVAYI